MRFFAAVIALGAALLLAAPCAAREALVVGGLSSGAYVYSGSHDQSIFF
jgi:hypothetical protein